MPVVHSGSLPAPISTAAGTARCVEYAHVHNSVINPNINIGNDIKSFHSETRASSQHINHQIHLLGSAFCVRELDGARVVLRKGRSPYLWHIARGPIATAVLAGMSAPVLAVRS